MLQQNIRFSTPLILILYTTNINVIAITNKYITDQPLVTNSSYFYFNVTFYKHTSFAPIVPDPRFPLE